MISLGRFTYGIGRLIYGIGRLTFGIGSINSILSVNLPRLILLLFTLWAISISPTSKITTQPT